MKEIKVTNTWIDIPCSRIFRINIVKLFVLLKVINRLNPISTTIPMTFFHRKITNNPKICIEP